MDKPGWITGRSSRNGTGGSGQAEEENSDSTSSATIFKIDTPVSQIEPVSISKHGASVSSTDISPCGVCTRCCVEYSVSVTGYDVWVIASRVGLAPEQFLVCYPVRSESRDGFRLDHTDVRYDIALDKIRVERPHQPCIFLMELPGGGGRCGIYAHRPHVCQTYPAYLDGDVVALRHDVMCPTGAWQLSRMHLKIWRRRLNDFVVQRDIYSHVVRCWNQRVAHAPVGYRFDAFEYYHFLLNVYPLLIQCMDQFSQNEWREIVSAWNGVHETRINPLNQAETPAFVQADKKLQHYVRSIKALVARFGPRDPADEGAPESQDKASPVRRSAEIQAVFGTASL